MKKILFILCCATALFSGCNAKKVNEDFAARSIPKEEQTLLNVVFYQIAPQLHTPISTLGGRDSTRAKIKELTVNIEYNSYLLGKKLKSSQSWIKNYYDEKEILIAHYTNRPPYETIDTVIGVRDQDAYTIYYVNHKKDGMTHQKTWKSGQSLITGDYNGDIFIGKDSCVYKEHDLPIESYRINSEGNVVRHYTYLYNEDEKIIGFTCAQENGYNGVVIYKKNKKILQIINPNGKKMVYSYFFDNNGRLVKSETPFMVTEYFNYDENGYCTDTKIRLRTVWRSWYLTNKSTTHTDIFYWE